MAFTMRQARNGWLNFQDVMAAAKAEANEYPGQAPCPACFESCGYECEHGNDWDSGPWSHQTNIPCRHCNGTGTVDSPLATLEDLEDAAADEAEARACNLGKGCDETGVCYAAAMLRPDMCGRLPASGNGG